MDSAKQKTLDNVKRVIRKTNNIAQTARELNLSRQTVYNYLKPIRAGKEPTFKKRGRPARVSMRLTPVQYNEIETIICDNTPDKIGIPYYLWSPKAIRILIKQKYDLTLSLPVILQFLKKWDFIPSDFTHSYWGDDIRWSKEQVKYYNKPSYDNEITISDYIQANNAQSYFLDIWERKNRNSALSTHSLYAVTKSGNVKFISVRWGNDSRYSSIKRNAYRRKTVCSFMDKLRKQDKKNVIVMHDLFVHQKVIGYGEELSNFKSKSIQMIAIRIKKRQK